MKVNHSRCHIRQRDVVRGFGYDLETHTVLTSDDYKLTVHRLLRGSQGQDAALTAAPSLPATDVDYGVPVLLVGGILQSSATKLVIGKAIGNILFTFNEIDIKRLWQLEVNLKIKHTLIDLFGCQEVK